jgi:hypothetical protein
MRSTPARLRSAILSPVLALSLIACATGQPAIEPDLTTYDSTPDGASPSPSPSLVEPVGYQRTDCIDTVQMREKFPVSVRKGFYDQVRDDLYSVLEGLGDQGIDVALPPGKYIGFSELQYPRPWLPGGQGCPYWALVVSIELAFKYGAARNNEVMKQALATATRDTVALVLKRWPAMDGQLVEELVIEITGEICEGSMCRMGERGILAFLLPELSVGMLATSGQIFAQAQDIDRDFPEQWRVAKATPSATATRAASGRADGLIIVADGEANSDFGANVTGFPEVAQSLTIAEPYLLRGLAPVMRPPTLLDAEGNEMFQESGTPYDAEVAITLWKYNKSAPLGLEFDLEQGFTKVISVVEQRRVWFNGPLRFTFAQPVRMDPGQYVVVISFRKVDATKILAVYFTGRQSGPNASLDRYLGGRVYTCCVIWGSDKGFDKNFKLRPPGHSRVNQTRFFQHLGKEDGGVRPEQVKTYPGDIRIDFDATRLP